MLDIEWKTGVGYGDFVTGLGYAHTTCLKYQTPVNINFHWNHSKDFKFTLKSKDGKILLQEVVTFGSEEQPFPENWKNDYFAQSSVLDYKQKFINSNFDIDISEDTEFDI